MKYILFLLALFLCAGSVLAQNANDVEMADALRSSGKIYVVVGVIVVVFIGIVIYLFSIDKRLRKIEKSK